MWLHVEQRQPFAHGLQSVLKAPLYIPWLPPIWADFYPGVTCVKAQPSTFAVCTRDLVVMAKPHCLGFPATWQILLIEEAFVLATTLAVGWVECS